MFKMRAAAFHGRRLEVRVVQRRDPRLASVKAPEVRRIRSPWRRLIGRIRAAFSGDRPRLMQMRARSFRNAEFIFAIKE
jgi:hypothetical protein